MDTDWILILKIKQGSESACDAFVRKYYGDILKYCHFHARQRSLSEDLTQEVFLRFFQSLSSYQHRGKAKNYLYTIAANLCRDQSDRGDLPIEEAQTAASPECPEDRLAIAMAVDHLPPELREVIILHYYQGLTLAETAAILNIGLSLTKYRLKRAKELLRKELTLWT